MMIEGAQAARMQQIQGDYAAATLQHMSATAGVPLADMRAMAAEPGVAHPDLAPTMAGAMDARMGDDIEAARAREAEALDAAVRGAAAASAHARCRPLTTVASGSRCRSTMCVCGSKKISARATAAPLAFSRYAHARS